MSLVGLGSRGGFLALAILLLALPACDASKRPASTPPPPPASPSSVDRALYPARWWAPVSKDGAPAWEILPQEAGPGEVILSKRHELGLLSNFAPTAFTFRGRRYASLEGFWQMMLYPDGPNDPRARSPGIEWKYSRDQVAQMSSFEAKKAGQLAEDNMQKMGIGWVSFEGRRFPYRSARPGEHYRLIVAATRAKVRQNSEVQRVLIATGDLVLKPDHHQEADAPPEWRYFEILTRIRAELRERHPRPVFPGDLPLAASAPDSFVAEFQTTKGVFAMKARRAWAPLGVDRLYHLVRSGYFDGLTIYRVGPTLSVKGGRVVQFGQSGDTAVARAWEKATFADEPVVRPHRRGSVNFARGGPNTRSVEIAITTNASAALDTVHYQGVVGFPSIAEVERGLDVLDRLEARYGNAPIANDSLSILGGEYLDRVFPGLDRIVGARVTKEWGKGPRR